MKWRFPVKKQKPPSLEDLQNPYATLDLFPEKVAEAAAEANRAAYRAPENPHARHYYYPEPELLLDKPADATERNAPESTPRSLPKKEFRETCRGIFRPYIPALERGTLRPHHRNFIARNESRPGSIRYALVAQLRRYDLSAIPGLTSQFNRESEDITAAKLAEIERTVGIEPDKS